MVAVILYTSENCAYCTRAKQLLTEQGVPYTEKRVDLNADWRTEMLTRSGGRRTVPQIFIGEQHIGGFDELYHLQQTGKLKDLL